MILADPCRTSYDRRTMSDISAPAPLDDNQPPILGVAELSNLLKRTVEENFGLVRVRGEISAPKIAASGHCYLRLKDENAVLDGIVWRGQMNKLGMSPDEGLEVVCTGRLTTYPGRSNYQIIIERMEIAGEGALLKMIEERRKRLAAEGLFDEDAKQDLPYLPDVIGVVTSPTGAVIRDILHRVADRFPRHVLLWPVAVQGDKAAAQIAAAIEGFNRIAPDGSVPRPDLLIVARGGGSIEDLMPFNEEEVVRAAAASTIPLISAVGHETDTTLIDYAADIRAPTPTAAAEMAVPVRTDLVAQVAEDGARTTMAMARRLADFEQRITGLGRGLPDPHLALETAMQRLDDWSERLVPAFARNAETRWTKVSELALRLPTPQTQLERSSLNLADLARRLTPAMTAATERGDQRLKFAGSKLIATMRQFGQGLGADRQQTESFGGRLAAAGAKALEAARTRLTASGDLLESFSYQRVLERGFTLVRTHDGAPLTSVAGAIPGASIAIVFHDGTADAVIGKTGTGRPEPADQNPGSRPKRKSKDTARDTSQGELL